MSGSRVECPGCGFLYVKIPRVCRNCGCERAPKSLDAPVARGFYGRGRPKSVAHRCPTCHRILLPAKEVWPWHFANPDTRRWCGRSDTPYPKAVTA
jgi:hypothetical protein